MRNLHRLFLKNIRVCVCSHVWIKDCRCPQSPEASDSSGDRIRGGCEPADMSVGKPTLALWEGSAQPVSKSSSGRNCAGCRG